jgi:glycerophosphoryl diester phosphodiesterase
VPARSTSHHSPLMDIVARARGQEPVLPVLVIAHRGDSQNAPENTLAAFQQAIDQGAELIELDLRETADGGVVVVHDDKVDRTTDGSGEVHKMRTGELRELSAGAWFADRYADERIPLLDEVLDLCRGRAVPMLEIKAKSRRNPELGLAIVDALERHNMQDQVVAICHDRARVDQIHQASPRTPLSTITFTKRMARTATRTPGVSGVDCYWKSLSLRLVQELRAASFFLTPWTVNRRKDMERLCLIGCEAIITDCPVALRDTIESFEFLRAHDLMERFRASSGELDIDLEEADEDEPVASPEEVSAAQADSEEGEA